MTTIVFSGGGPVTGFRMDPWNVGFLLSILAASNTVVVGTPTQVTYTNDFTSGGRSTIVASGTFSDFNEFGDPQNGTVTGFVYTTRGFSPGVDTSMSVSGISIGVPTLYNWILTNNVAALEAALFGGADTMTGTDFNDSLNGMGGNDLINGGAGNDELVGGLGDDTLAGGDGNDQLDILGNGDGFDTLQGGAGDDRIASRGPDSIDGGSGTDFLELYRTASAAMTLSVADLATDTGVTLSDGTVIRNIESVAFNAGSGNDTLILNAPGVFGSAFRGGGGTDTLIADFSGFATGFNLNAGGQFLIGLFANYSLESVEQFQVTTGSGNDTLLGGTGNDTLNSRGGADWIEGRGGNDTLDGGDGNDTVFGGAGDDIVRGGAGNDTLTDTEGVNTLRGEDGDDTISGGSGDTIDGGAGFDTLLLDRSAATAAISVAITAAGYTITGTTTNAVNMEAVNLTSGSGNDSYSISGLTSGTFRFDANGGVDRLIVDFSLVTGDLMISPFSVHSFGAGLSVFATGVEEIVATGGSGNDSLSGVQNNDVLNGGAGNDAFNGGGGADTLNGQDGNDVLANFGTGSVVDGGAGNDRVTLDGSLLTSAINFNAAAFGGPSGSTFNGSTIRNVESFIVVGAGGNDLFTFQALVDDNTVVGQGGTDSVVVDLSAATDMVRLSSAVVVGPSGRLVMHDIESITLTGGGGDDFMIGISGANELHGGAGFDQLSGNAFDDRLFGDDGSDELTGGLGADMLDGGAGTDTAIFSFARSQAPILKMNGQVMVVGPGDQGRDSLISIEQLQFSDQTVAVSSVEEFSVLDYVAGYNDLIAVYGVADLGGAVEHFIRFGFAEGRDTEHFDGFQYLAGYNDLIAAFGPDEERAARHFIQFGISGGRERDAFNGADYIASYNDLILAFGLDEDVAARHFVHFGLAAGRERDLFDGWQYLASYNDLISVIGADEAAAARHFVRNGFGEGRSRDIFNGIDYIASYDDLILAFGSDETAGARHFVESGFAGGRSRDAFDGLQYIASYGDLIGAFGADEDVATAARHFIQFGFAEGRSRDDFDAAQYIANYADLQAAFGSDLHEATRHYIHYGFFEGRTDEDLSGSIPPKPEAIAPEVLVAGPEASKAQTGPLVLIASAEAGLKADAAPDILPGLIDEQPLIDPAGFRERHPIEVYPARDLLLDLAGYAKAGDVPDVLPAAAEGETLALALAGPGLDLDFGMFGRHGSLIDLLRQGQPIHPDWAVIGA